MLLAIAVALAVGSLVVAGDARRRARERGAGRQVVARPPAQPRALYQPEWLLTDKAGDLRKGCGTDRACGEDDDVGTRDP